MFCAGREQVTDVWIAGRPVVARRQMIDDRALCTVSEVLGRYAVWHNRLGKIVPEAA
jgi:hypothetical protein